MWRNEVVVWNLMIFMEEIELGVLRCYFSFCLAI
jgi:hypothetical protein